MFLGEYNLKFSGRGRLVLPRKMRQNIDQDKEIILSRGFEGCIWGFSKKGFEDQSQKQLQSSVTEERARMLGRFLFSGSVPVELDAQGRFVIPSALLTYAKVEKEVVIIGAGDHFEVWNNKFWQKHIKEVEEVYGKVS